jgi:hypothetical protein
MRLALTALGMFVLVGCSSDTVAPTAPTSPPVALSSSAFVVAMVVPADGSGICIPDAKVEVVAGQARGLTATQSEPCDVWDAGGIHFGDLRPGAEMTLRASAPGYSAQEKVVIPRAGPQGATIFELSRSR